MAHRKVTSFPKNTSHSVLSKHEGTKAGTTGFSVYLSSNKCCLPVGQALGFSTKTWASGAHSPAHNPVSQPGVPAPPPTARTPTPTSPGAQAVLTTTLQARWRASVTSGARWARKGPRRPKQFAQGCVGSQLLAEPRLEHGVSIPDPGHFWLLDKIALSWQTNNVAQEQKGLRKVGVSFPVSSYGDLFNLLSIHPLTRQTSVEPYLCQAGPGSQGPREEPLHSRREMSSRQRHPR